MLDRSAYAGAPTSFSKPYQAGMRNVPFACQKQEISGGYGK